MTATQHATDEPIDVLLVEDNPGDVRLTREAFEATDREMNFHVFRSGEVALEFLRQRDAADVTPDIALVDLNLPGRDGYEILETIRDDPDLHQLPVIILTSSADRADIERCYAASANAYLTKPSDPAEFERIAERVEQFWIETARLPPVPA